MSRAFVREDREDLDPLPDLPLSPHPNLVTPRGLAALQARLAAAQALLAGLRTRADRLDRLPEAAAERDIRYLEARLRTAIVIDPQRQPRDVAGFGHRLRLADPAGGERVFEITGEDEADPALGRIAPHAPLARALLGAAPGDLVIWRRPAGAVELELLAIEVPDDP